MARSADGAEHVAVRAHELALLQLREGNSTSPTDHELADTRDLVKSRQVVPVHDPCRKHLATIGARDAFLERGHPCTRGSNARALALKTRNSPTFVVVATVIGAAARSAVGELTCARIMEFAFRLP